MRCVLRGRFKRRFFRSGLEPYGFLVLVICLWYVISQRVIADERRLVSLTDEMRAARKIQEAILQIGTRTIRISGSRDLPLVCDFPKSDCGRKASGVSDG